MIAEVAHPFFPCHRPLPETIGSWHCGGAVDRQEPLALPQEVDAAVGIFCVRFTRAVQPGLTIVPSGLAGPQADLIAPAFEPFVEGLPGDPGWCHGDQERLTPGFDQGCFEGLCKAPEALPGMGQRKLATAHGGRRPQASTVFGFADINTSEEEVRLVYVRCALMGGSSLLL